MAVRSEYIKKLMNSANSLDKQFEGVVKESMKNIIGENAKKEIRQLLKEADDEDSYEEEDVVDDIADSDSKGEEMEGSEEDTDLWDDLEKCKTADGEYDCTGMDNDKLMDVVNSMGSEDGIRIVSNGDGTATLEVDGDLIDGEKEFVIDLNDLEEEGEIELSAESNEDEDDDILDDGEDEEVEFEIDADDTDGEDFDDDDEELDESFILEIENTGNTGYTNKYQKKTAMTTLPNKETAPNEVNDWDDGAPHGESRPWAPKGDTQPYSNEVNEGVDECSLQLEYDDDDLVDEASRTQGGKKTSVGKGSTMSKKWPEDYPYSERNSRGGGKQVTPTTDAYNGVKESKHIRQRMNTLYNENKQMKAIIPELQKRVEESIVINASMGYIVKLLNENTTTVDEKKQISERFGQVNSINECKKLYEQISRELKNAGKSNGLSSLDKQLSEGKQRLIETTMYKSEKVNDTLDFMKRLDAIK